MNQIKTKIQPGEKTIMRRSSSFAPEEEEIITEPSRLKPFDRPEVGDKVKPI